MTSMETTPPERHLEKEIREVLNQAGLTRIDKDVFRKCIALASTLHVSSETMGTCWEAFSLTNNVSELTSHTFEGYKAQVYRHSESTSPSITNEGSVQFRNCKRQSSAHLVTPPAAKRNQAYTAAFDSSVSMAGQANQSSPGATSTPKYEERSKAGHVDVSFNPKRWPAFSVTSPAVTHRCVIDSKGIPHSKNITEHYRHMFSTLSDRAQALENHLVYLGQQIIEKHGISNGENGFAPLEQIIAPRQDVVCCVGRICNEAHEGKLNSTSIVLEGSSASCGGARVNIDLSQLMTSKQPYSLFPGQIVAIEGMNPSGRKLIAHRICEGAPHPPNTASVGDLRKFYHEKQEGMPVKIMTASGPFTTCDSLSYQPFVDFLHIVLEQSPDVVILTGPFVDLQQEKVKSGQTKIELDDGDGNLIEKVVPFETVFMHKVLLLIEDVFSANESLKTQFVLVPSLNDATAKWVYPQPPFEEKYSLPQALNIPGTLDAGEFGIERINKDLAVPRVHCFSNPCTFKINEITFGVTSTDILFHVSAEETNANLEPGSRLRRIAQHMLQQRSYYPLFPPPQSVPINLDLKYMENWSIPCTPDILIVPSRLSCFANSLLGSTVVVNPGHITRGTTGGTYCIMEIHPMNRQALEKSGGDDVRLQLSLPDRINVEIKRI